MKKKCEDILEGGNHMAVSKAIVPMLSDDIAKIFMKNISEAKIKPYSSEKKEETMSKIEKTLRERNKK